jgi:hypothetical protein
MLRSLSVNRGLWTQRQAAAYLGVSQRYLRDSSCPKLLLPGNGPNRLEQIAVLMPQTRRWPEAGVGRGCVITLNFAHGVTGISTVPIWKAAV